MTALAQWLEALGYRLAWRSSGWTECLIWSGRERWLGRGGDATEAFRDALAQMVPSQAARSLLAERFEARAPAEPVTPPKEEVEPVEQLAGCEEPSPEPEPIPEAAEPEPEPVILAVVIDLPAPEPPAPVEPVIVVPAPPPPAVFIRRAEVPLMGVDEALSEADMLSSLIDSEQPELALMTTERQRLAILAWICRARALEAATDNHSRVKDRVAAIAKQLTRLSKIWWPGSVRALQLEATPRDVGYELDLPTESRPRTWTQSADMAEERLGTVEARDEVAGRDEYGWSDGACLEPGPLSPHTSLVEVRALIEQLSGPLTEPPPRRAPVNVRQPSPEERKRFVDWAMRVRWLRGFVTDFDGWGAVMGRLRWIAAQLERKDELLDRILDPAYRPQARTWALALGQDPLAKRKRRQKRDVLQRRPLPGGRPTRADLAGWLNEALQVLEANRVAELLASFREAILELTPEDLPGADRSQRRRLKSVQKHIGDLTAADFERIAREPPMLSEPDEPATHDADEVLHSDPAQMLLESVQPRTQGLRALFVSNRTDPQLEETIRHSFGFKALDWCEGSPRRVQTVAERVAAGSYDIVLGATGFQSHSMDTHLMRACRRAGVRYIRVHRGRQLACTLALARELGISAAVA